jgi:hypothetical protein
MLEPSFLSGLLTKYDINSSQAMLMVLLIVMGLSLFYTSSDIGISEIQSYAAVISIVMCILVISLFKLFTDKSSIFIRGATISVIAIFIVGGVFVEFYQNYLKRSDVFDRASRDPTTRVAINIVEISLMLSIIVVGISFANNIFGRYLNNSTDWLGFILNLIVYVPCLLEDLVKYFKQQYDLTSSVTFILLAIEAALVAIYLAMPLLFASKLVDDSIQIINEPVFLDIPVSKTFKKQDDGDKTMKRTNYSISSWVYLNQQASSTDTAHIFSYGDSYPKVEYIKSNTNSGKDKYRFTVTGQTPYDISLPNQKWNNIVLNFNEDRTVDIFVNGNLERTFASSKRLSSDNGIANVINIGSTNGLYGAICNVKYYRAPLTQTQIIQNYNLMYNKNPPVNKIM